GNAWLEQNQLLKVPIVERQLSYLLAGDSSRFFGCSGLNGSVLGCDFDAFTYLSGLQMHVQRVLLSDIQNHVICNVRLKAPSRDRHRVVAGSEIGDVEISSVSGGNRAYIRRGRIVTNYHRCSWYDRSAGIGDRAGEGGCHLLRLADRGNAEDCGRKSD